MKTPSIGRTGCYSAQVGTAKIHKRLFHRLPRPGTQRVELTGPETGGANEANRSGPATGRSSEVHGRKQWGPEARLGGGLTRFRYLAGTAGGRPGQKRAQRWWKGPAINNYILDSASSWTAVKKSACPACRRTKAGVAITLANTGKIPRRQHPTPGGQNRTDSEGALITYIM